MRNLRFGSLVLALSAAVFAVQGCSAGATDGPGGGGGSSSSGVENPNGDDDLDGILNKDEGDVDTDGDGVPDRLDLDSDGDGIPDAIEGGDTSTSTPPVDSDGDGIPDFQDPDSDADGIPDSVEGTIDTDTDGLPNYLDDDSDGDSIPDDVESGNDFDLDGIPNYLDLDSDGDGLDDVDEGTVDSDLDGVPNFLDQDSDNDGLPDAKEAEYGTDPTNPDTDGDGDSDLVEVVLHEQCMLNPDACNGDPDPLDPNSGVSPDDFVFVLPYQDPSQNKDLDFLTTVRKADVHFSVDITGSMSEEIDNLKTGLSSVITQISDPTNGIPDSAFGVSAFADFPVDPYGGSGDEPYKLLQRVTTVPSEAIAGVNALFLEGGSDTPEANYEALFQAASGIGLPGGNQFPAGILPYDPMVNYDATKNGLIGGAGFRAGALPMIIEVTDARGHTNSGNQVLNCQFGTEPLMYDVVTKVPPLTHGEYQAIAVAQADGIRVMGLASNQELVTTPCNPRGHMVPEAEQTGAIVPPAAFTDPINGRPAGCAVTDCCTGIDGAGRPPNAMGDCPLVFDVNSNGTGAFTSLIVTAVRALTKFALLDVSAETNSHTQPAADGTLVDPAEFIKAITAISLTPPPPGGTMIDVATQTFLDVSPGAIAKFNVLAQNDFLPEATQTQVFTLKIDVVGDDVTVLDQRQVVIIVPAKFVIVPQ